MHQIKEMPHRLPRSAYRGQVRAAFVVCAAHRKPLFDTQLTQQLLLDILRRKSARYQCSVTVYVIMPDHLHIILRGETDDADLYACVVQVKRSFSYALGRRIWQKDFFDHLIRDRNDLAQQIMYVLFNPVRAGLVQEWWQYHGSGSLSGTLDEMLQFARDMRQLAEREGRKW
jgi:REP element-mobilizing transposase RayT